MQFLIAYQQCHLTLHSHLRARLSLSRIHHPIVRQSSHIWSGEPRPGEFIKHTGRGLLPATGRQSFAHLNYGALTESLGRNQALSLTRGQPRLNPNHELARAREGRK